MMATFLPAMRWQAVTSSGVFTWTGSRGKSRVAS